MKKVLLVEDDASSLYMLTFLLEKNGFAVIQARTGLEPVRQAQEDAPDVILMDIRLPETHGYDAIREIMAIPGLTKIRIIAVSSSALSGGREEALATGCAGYIEKPILPESFISQIQEFLAQWTAPRS